MFILGITYEEMRNFYADQERREQMLIVQVQKLIQENKELKQENLRLKEKYAS